MDAVVLTDGTAEVYNLTVDEAHTYFVGDGAWLVHNSCTWVPKKNMTSEQHAEKHWNDHKSEFPEYTYASEYIQGAHDFINNPPQTTLICVGSSEDTIMYDPQTNRLLIYRTSDKVPITFYKPVGATPQDLMNHFLTRN